MLLISLHRYEIKGDYIVSAFSFVKASRDYDDMNEVV